MFGLVAQWKRVCLLSRRLWVRPPPGSYKDLFVLLYFLMLALFPSSFDFPCKQGWPSGPRRQFKVLFSSEAWVRTPLLAFLLTLSNFFHLRFLLFPFISQGLLAQSAVRSPSKGKVVGSIPAEALLFFFSPLYFLYNVVSWRSGNASAS